MIKPMFSHARTAILAASLLLGMPGGPMHASAHAGEVPDVLARSVQAAYPDGPSSQRVMGALDRALERGVPPESLQPVVERAGHGRLSGAALADLVETVGQARGNDLPVGPLVDKILEGLAKEVPESLIGSAVDRVAGRLSYAAELAALVKAGPAERDRFVITAADALAAGMDRQALREVVEDLSSARKSGSITLLQVMEVVKTASGYGVESGKVQRMARDLLEDRDAGEDEIRNILMSLSGDTSSAEEGEKEDEEDGSGREDDGEAGEEADGEGEEEGEEEGGEEGGEESPGEESGVEEGEGDTEEESSDHGAEEETEAL